jgi:hypothetical protein
MPKLFNSLSNNQYVSQHVGLPIKELDTLGTTLETRYNDNIATADKLEVGLANLKVRDVNRPIVQGQLDNVRKGLASTVEAGNWENASMLVRQQAKAVATSPELAGALEDKAQYDAWTAELNAGLKDGTYNKEQYDFYLTKAAEQNGKPIEVDPDTGAVSNVFNFGKPTKDMSEEIKKYMTELSRLWKSNTVDSPVSVTYTDKAGKQVQGSIMYKDGKTGAPPGYYDVEQKKYITEDEVRSAMTAAVMGDPKYRSFVEESSRIKAWQAEKTNGGVFTINDLAGPTNPNAVFTLEEFSALEASLLAEGKDPDAILADPDMVKAYFMLGSRNEIINGMIEAPVQATAFQETEHKFMVDIQFQEALRLRNDLAKVREQGRQARQTQREKQDYEKEAAAQFVVKNRGPVIDKQATDNASIAAGVAERQTELKQVQAEIARHQAAGTNPNDIAQLMQKEAQLKTQISISGGQVASKAIAYYNTPEGNDLAKELYTRYKEFNPKVRGKELSFEEFKNQIVTPDQKASGWWGRLLNKTVAFTEGLAPENNANSFNDFMQTSHNKLMRRIDKVEAANELPGLSGFTYDSEDLGNKSAIFRVANETKTRAYEQNRTGYYIPNGNGGELSAVEWETALRKKYADQDLEVKIVTSDADHSSNGVALFPDKIAVVDKKTGATIREEWIYPIDGGADEMLQIGIRGRKEFPRGTQAHEDATRMAAMGTYTNLIQADLNKASADVKPGSGRTWKGEPIDISDGGGTLRVIPVKVDQPNYDPQTGAKIGNNTRWQFQAVDADGNTTDAHGKPYGFIPNRAYFDANGNINVDGIDSPTDIRLYQFENVNDAKVSIYKLNNGE